MLNWMFNRQKTSGGGGLEDKSSAKLRDLADTVRTIAPDEFGADQKQTQSRHIPRKSTKDEPNVSPGLQHAARLSSEIEATGDDDVTPDFDSDVRMDVARRLRRYLKDVTPSERLVMVDEFVSAIMNMGECYRPQVIALIEQELGHTPYMTRQAAMRLRQDIAAIGRVSIGDYIELLSDADFLDIVRGRGEFVQTAAQKAAEQARLKEKQVEKAREKEREKGGLLNRLLSSDDAPRNVVSLTPHLNERQNAKPETPENSLLDGENTVSRQAQRRIAHFIMASLFDTLVEQGRMRTEVARAMRQSVRQRIEKARFDNRMPSREHDDLSHVDIADGIIEETGAEVASNAQMTIDQYILDALSRHEDALVVEAIAQYAQIPTPIVSKILDSGSARAITALAWRSGMTAPSAVVLQLSNGIPDENIERPAAGGRYGMAAPDMDWYIDFFNDLKPSGPRTRSASSVDGAAKATATPSSTRAQTRRERNSVGLEGLVSDKRSPDRKGD